MHNSATNPVVAQDPKLLAVLPNACKNQTQGGTVPSGPATPSVGKGFIPVAVTGDARPAEKHFGGLQEGSSCIDTVAKAEAEQDLPESAPVAPASTTPVEPAVLQNWENALPENQVDSSAWWREAEAYFAEKGKKVTAETTADEQVAVDSSEAQGVADTGAAPGVKAAMAALALAFGGYMPGRAEESRWKLGANLVVKRPSAV
jgi:hypothetical protein